MSLFTELGRRNVFRVAAAYVVTAWLVIQVVETILPAFGYGDTAVRYVTIAFAVGLIPVLVLSWVFEWTPEGIKREADVDDGAPASLKAAKRFDRMILVVLALALGYFAFDKFILDPRREAKLEAQKGAAIEEARQQGRAEALVESYGEKSIAVLAFKDMSPRGDQGYFSDGIAEELLTLLAKIPELRVISRSSAFSYKGKDIKLAQVARELSVAHILEGSVRTAGNRVRITTQLIEARSDTHLWSETYDRQLDDIFAIQDDIAAKVVDQLKVKLLGVTPRVKATDPEAYALYLQGRHLARVGTAQGYEQSIALYRQALSIDPDYTATWEALTGTYLNQAGLGLVPLHEGFALAREAAEQGLAIDPDYAPAHASLGWIAMHYDNDLARAARHFEQALRPDPGNTGILGNAATLLYSLGRLEQAITLGSYATARDPVDPSGYYNLGASYRGAGRWDEAIASYETALRLSPGYIGAHYHIGAVLLDRGEAKAALAAMQREESVLRLIGLPMAWHALGDERASDAALAELIEKHEQDAAYNIAYVQAFLNDADRAFEWLDKAVEYGDPGLSAIVVQPEFGDLKSDARWLPFLESIGRAPAQLDAIKFEVSLPR